MKIKFDFGKTKSGDLNALFVNLANAIRGVEARDNIVFGGCTVYANFYDENGRIVDVFVPVTNKVTGKTSQKALGFIFRNKKFTKNEDTESMEYAGTAPGGLYKYWTYDDSYVKEW